MEQQKQPQNQPSGASPAGPRARKSVPYRDALVFGLIAGLVTFVVAAASTVGSRFATEGPSAVVHLGPSALYGGVALVAATVMAALLNWVVSRKDVEQPDGPVLH